MKKPLPSWVWPLALLFGAFFLLSGIVFVVDAVRETKTHSTFEETVLIGGLVVGVSLVAFFQLRTLTNGVLASRLMRWIVLTPILIAVIFIFLHVFKMEIMSAPEYPLALTFLKNSTAVQAEYGQIHDLQLDSNGLNFQIENDLRSGTFQFETKGDRKTGHLRLSWKTTDGQFTPLEVDDVSGDESLTSIWKK
jgi:hypothetical protein